MSEENKIGAKIRQLREDHGMSVKELAETSHNSVESIENIESGALVPSLSPLMKIARALGVRLGTFMDDAPHSGPFIVKSGKSENIISPRNRRIPIYHAWYQGRTSGGYS
jgi:transcriptional regulator with XRE-family HTH domain